MTTNNSKMSIEDKFKLHNDEFLEFDRVEGKKSNRPDLHGLILLDNLYPSERFSDIMDAAMNDHISINIPLQSIDSLSHRHVVELTRCGFSYSKGDQRLYMIK